MPDEESQYWVLHILIMSIFYQLLKNSGTGIRLLVQTSHWTRVQLLELVILTLVPVAELQVSFHGINCLYSDVKT